MCADLKNSEFGIGRFFYTIFSQYWTKEAGRPGRLSRKMSLALMDGPAASGLNGCRPLGETNGWAAQERLEACKSQKHAAVPVISWCKSLSLEPPGWKV